MPVLKVRLQDRAVAGGKAPLVPASNPLIGNNHPIFPTFIPPIPKLLMLARLGKPVSPFKPFNLPDVVWVPPPPILPTMPPPLVMGLRGVRSIVNRPRTMPLPVKSWTISGVTKDSTGAILGSCVVALYRTIDGLLMETTTSDAVTGAYSFSTVGGGKSYFVVAYKAGSPDVAGTTVNTLSGV